LENKIGHLIVPDGTENLIELQSCGKQIVPNLKEHYAERLEREVGFMLPYLPGRCDSILDVGCGLGGASVLLRNFYRNTGRGDPRLYLLDGDQIDALQYGVVKGSCFYSLMNETSRLMLANGVPEDRFELCLAPDWLGEEHGIKFDLVISLASWCFHYGPEVYLEQVRRVSHDRTQVVVDIRYGLGDIIYMMKKAFGDAHSIPGIGKSYRLVFTGRKP